MKRNMFKIVMAIMIAITIVACTKFGKNITVKGRVLNPITSEGYEGITVELIRSDHSDYAGGYKKIQSTISDTDGSFEIEATRLGPIWLSTNITKYEKYYKLGWLDDTEGKYYSMKKVDKGKVMHIDCHLVPYGNYQLKINNVNCGGGADTLIINQTNQIGTFLGVDWVITGCNGYVTALEKVPMGTVHTKYTVIRNGVSNTYTVDFEVKPNQDNIQEINY